MGTEPGSDGTTPEIRRLLTAADYFLQRGLFADCCKYASRARDSEPTNPDAIRIHSTAAILAAPKISSAHHDYYAVLNLPYFETDELQIASSFQTLSSIVDPETNPYPFAPEAFDLTLQAWSVLSNSEEKARFDGELRRYMSGSAPGSGGGTFWTMCPYCYYVYEYESVFEDCCLRCANESCRRVMHAVAIGGPPPPDVVEKGQYCCPGFMPFNVRGSYGQGIGERLWLPFKPADYVGNVGNVSKGLDLNSASYEDCILVVDDDKFEKTGFQEHGHGNGVGAKLGPESGNGVHNRDAYGERPENAGNSVGSNAERIRMKRKKSVPWKSKKLLGRGIRIDAEQAHFVYGVRVEGCSNVEQDENDLLEPCYGGKSVGGVEFLEGDEDLLISFPCDFDLGNGRPMSL